MAENKILNTRVQLKYDTLAQWSEKNPTLLAGELAIVSLGNSHTTTTPDNGTHPILFKVGPGAFNSLPFASALAADVYAWAKKPNPDWADFSEIPAAKLPVIPETKLPVIPGIKLGLSVKDEGTGKFVTDVTYDETTKTFTISRDDESKDFGKVTADTGEIEADAVHDTFAIVGDNNVISTTADGSTITISADLSKYAEILDVEIVRVAEGTGIDVTTASEGERTTVYTVAHQDKPTTGDAAQSTAGSGRTYVTEVLVDNLGHIAGVKTATETVVNTDTNTAHTHSEGAGLKLTGTGGIDGDVKYELNIAMELIEDNIVIYDAEDSEKTAIASMSASEFIKDGMIKSVELVDRKENENEATGQYLKITWNIDDVNGTDEGTAADVVYLDVTELVDVYTGGATEDITVSVSNANVITATLNKQFALASDLDNYKTKQVAVDNQLTDAAHVVSILEQNENGDISYEVKMLTPEDIGAQPAGDYQPAGNYKTQQTAVNETGSTTKTITAISQNENGVIDVTYSDIAFPAPVDISGKKDKQTAVVDAITNRAHVLDSLTQNENGEIAYTVKELSGYDIKEVSTAKNSSGSDVDCLIFYCGTASDLV